MQKSEKGMNHPFLTIGIASYNYAAYLPRAWEQIERQAFTDFEILYCDDGSSDGSLEWIRTLIAAHPERTIRLIEGAHDGVIANRNRILDNARGEYLLICDADDYMSDNCLALLCAAARAQQADCVIGGFDEVDAAGRALKIHVPGARASKWLYTWHHAQMYRTDLVRQYGLRFTELPDDVCFLQPLHAVCGTVSFVPQVVYHWVRHADSTSRDLTANPTWSPTAIFASLCRCMANLLQSAPPEDRAAMTYYLYKWFYFNVCDLAGVPKAKLKPAAAALQAQMRETLPNYRRFFCLTRALQTPDTAFARCAVLGCWLLEGLGCLTWAARLRALQNRLRG